MGYCEGCTERDSEVEREKERADGNFDSYERIKREADEARGARDRSHDIIRQAIQEADVMRAALRSARGAIKLLARRTDSAGVGMVLKEIDDSILQPVEAKVVHMMDDGFAPLCGHNEPRWSWATVIPQVTCPRCLEKMEAKCGLMGGPHYTIPCELPTGHNGPHRRGTREWCPAAPPTPAAADQVGLTREEVVALVRRAIWGDKDTELIGTMNTLHAARARLEKP